MFSTVSTPNAAGTPVASDTASVKASTRMSAATAAEKSAALRAAACAIAAAFWSFLQPGDEVIVDKTLYDLVPHPQQPGAKALDWSHRLDRVAQSASRS